MGLTNLPTRGVDTDLGPEKKNNPLAALSRYFKIAAEEWNSATLAIYEMAQALGLGDGSTVGSIEAERIKNAVEIGGALADADKIPIFDATDSTVKSALLSRLHDYLLTKIPIAWGTWAPTATIVTNLDAVTPSPGMHIRVGDIVVCGAIVNVDATATGAVQFKLSPPVVSNFLNNYEAVGVANGDALTVGRVQADTANDLLDCYGTVSVATSRPVFVVVIYEVIQ